MTWRNERPRNARSSTLRWVGISWRSAIVPPLPGAERRLNHAGDDAGGEDDREAGDRVEHRRLARLHLAGRAAGAHVLERAPHQEEGGDGHGDAESDAEQVREEYVDRFHAVPPN